MWIKLDARIDLGPLPEESIVFWSGIIKDVQVKVEVEPKDSGEGLGK